MGALKPDVTFICEVHPHHAAHHAVYRIITEIGGVRLGGRRRYGAQSPWVNWCDRQLFRLSGNAVYTLCNFHDELKAAGIMLARPHRLIHVIHGDDGFRYLGLLNGVRGARIIASFHQPPAILDRKSVV